MTCRETRDCLLDGRPATGAAAPARQAVPQANLDEHLATCAACAEFARRLGAARGALAAHHAGARPDPAFAARVIARLSSGKVELLGWAALRLLPATVAVLLVLVWFTARTGSSPAGPEPPAPTENVVSWVVDQAGAP